MDHQIYSDQEVLKLSNNLVDGIASYQVIEGKWVTSKSGNPMVALKFKVWDQNGTDGMIRDWILLTPVWAKKFKSFWESCGHLELYNRGKSDDDDYPGKTGKCKIKWTESKDNKYPGSMRITEYLPHEEAPPKTYDEFYTEKPVQKESVDTPPPMTDDDIPF